jgi:tetratricopeptide (TPR) repeat protein
MRTKYILKEQSPAFVFQSFHTIFTENDFMTLRLIFLLLVFFNSQVLLGQSASSTARQEQVIEQYLRKGAWKFPMYSQEWQLEIDKGLKEDSTIAYLWQQKAMPLYKQKRYAEGLPYLDKAVLYNRQEYLHYRGFMKCIFSKDYRGAIDDFEACIKERGNSYVMDHSYKFYMALSFIQLGEFKKAEKLLAEDTEYVAKTRGENWVHHLDLLYLGISQLRQNSFKASINSFDKALKLYPQFSEVYYYKAEAMKSAGIPGHDSALKLAKEFFKAGHTINEDNAIYEKYPYQLDASLLK